LKRKGGLQDRFREARRSDIAARQLLAGNKPPPGPSELPVDHGKHTAIGVPACFVAKRYRKQPEPKPSLICPVADWDRRLILGRLRNGRHTWAACAASSISRS